VVTFGRAVTIQNGISSSGKRPGAAQGGTLNCPRHLEVTVAADDDAKRGTIAVRCRVREILA